MKRKYLAAAFFGLVLLGLYVVPIPSDAVVGAQQASETLEDVEWSAGNNDGLGADGANQQTAAASVVSDIARAESEANQANEGVTVNANAPRAQRPALEKRALTEGSGGDPLRLAPSVSADGTSAPRYEAPKPGSSSIEVEPATTDVNINTLPEFLTIEIETTDNYGFVQLDVDQVVDALGSSQVTVPLLGDASITLETADAPSPGAMDSLVYRAFGDNLTGHEGHLDDNGNHSHIGMGHASAVWTISDIGVIGQIFSSEGQWGIMPVPNADGLHLMFQVKRDFPNEAEPDMAPGPDNGPSGLTVQELGLDTASGDVIGVPAIDVMIAYDAEAFSFYGSNLDTVRANAAAMVNLTNMVYRNSSSQQHLNLTNIFATGVTPNTNSISTYRNQLANKTDGNFDNVHTARDNNNADLIVLLSNRFVSTGLCGIAFFPDSANPAENDAYNVTETSCALGGLTFPHELGHNQCAGHDVTGGTCPGYADDKGHVDSGANSRTVMARNSNPEVRQPVFSNPSVTFAGFVTGVTGSADNHRVMELEDCDTGNVSGGLSNYRAPTGCGGQVSVAGVDGASCIFASVEDAVNNAAAGSTIYVAPGTHPMETANVNANISRNFTIEQGSSQCEDVASGQTATDVVLQLASGSTNDAVLEIFNSAAVTLRDLTVEGGNSAEGTVYVSSGASVVLDNVVVRNGANPSTTLGGGGVRINNADVTSINNSQIISNDATNLGGGVYVENGGTFTMDGVDDVEANTAASGAGIAAVGGSTVNVTNDADVLSNVATSDGGGVYLSDSTLTVDGNSSTLVRSNSSNRGGGVFLTGSSTATVVNGAIDQNTANFGGGVYPLGSTASLIVQDAGSIDNNTANTNGGGVLAVLDATVTLNGTAAIVSNTTPGIGGGIWISDGTLIASGTTGGTGSSQVLFSSNSATDGAGLYVSANGAATLDTVRFASNAATASGGGIYVAQGANINELGVCDAADTVFERYCNEFQLNTAADGGAIYVAGGTLFVEQAAFVNNSATNGQHAVAAAGTSTVNIEASLFRDHPASAGGNGIVTLADSATGSVLAATFADNAGNFADTDGAATLQLDRVLTTSSIFGGTYSGDCNLTSGAGSWGSAIVTAIASIDFQTTANSAYVPESPQALDECAGLGRISDIGDQGVINSDGVPSSTEFEIGAWEAPETLILCNGLPVSVNIGIGETPTAGDDVILGTAGDDIIDGLAGNDTICGLEGNDDIRGDLGDDTIFGDDGDDMLRGREDNDTIFGGRGADFILGNDGADVIDGQEGADTIFGGSGDDNISGGPGNDRIGGSSDNDILSGGEGRDNVAGGGGVDVISGGPDDDTINAGTGDDVDVRGNGGNDTMSGNGGNDIINGDGGNDIVRGGNGDDIVNGNAGDDQLFGNPGNDTCDGGSGTDTANVGNCETIVNVP